VRKSRPPTAIRRQPAVHAELITRLNQRVECHTSSGAMTFPLNDAANLARLIGAIERRHRHAEPPRTLGRAALRACTHKSGRRSHDEVPDNAHGRSHGCVLLSRLRRPMHSRNAIIAAAARRSASASSVGSRPVLRPAVSALNRTKRRSSSRPDSTIPAVSASSRRRSRRKAHPKHGRQRG